MKHIITIIGAASFSAAAWADKYGIDEAMSDGGSGDLADAILGGLIIWVIWMVWKKFFG